MISIDDSEKSKYKDYNREIKVLGNMYIATKEISSNVFTYNVDNPYLSNYATASNDDDKLKITSTNTTNRSTYVTYSLPTSQILGKKIYFSCYFESTSLYPQIYLFGMKNGRLVTALMGNYKNNISVGKLSFSYTFPNEMPSQYDTYTIGFYARTTIRQDVQSDDYTSYYDIMISEENKSYQEYGTIANNYNTLETKSKNLLDAKRYFGTYYDGEKYKYVFSKTNALYNETEFINIGETELIKNKRYAFVCNITKNENNLNTGLAVACYDSNGTLLKVDQKQLSKKLGIEGMSFIIPSNATQIKLRINITSTATTNTIEVEDIQITDVITPEATTFTDYNYWPYEEYNTSPFRLTADNNCEILSININEKADIYYTSLPYSTMTIEINNEYGYFTDEDENSIVNLLNSDCYVDLFMKINDGNYFKIKTMNFSKISYSDYKIAKLEFTSCISKVNDIVYEKDKNEMIRTAYNKDFGFDKWRKYVDDNYNMKCVSDHPLIDTMYYISLGNYMIKDFKTFVLYTGTGPLGGLYRGTGTLLTSDYNNCLMYKAISNISNETINKDLQLEFPKIRKDNIYKKVKYSLYQSVTEEQTSLTYKRRLNNKLQSKKDVLIYRDNNYTVSDITINDITVQGNVNVTIGQNAQNYRNILTIIVEGEIGEDYAITINKSNISIINYEGEEIYAFGTDLMGEGRTLVINPSATYRSGITTFLYIKKPVLSYIEVKMMGLPYLEIGDTITIDLENKSEKIIITDINTNFKEGFIQTIKGYKLDWTYQAPSPYDDLNNWT